MNPWERQPSESDKAYAAFCCYRDLPPAERSLDLAYQQKQRQNSGKKKRVRHPRWWSEWSTKFNWVERVKAFDAVQQRKALVKVAARRQKDIEAFVNTDMLVSQGIQRIVSRKIAELMKQPIEALNATELRLLAMAYDASRGWAKELIGLFDEQANWLDELALSDEGLAQRAEEQGFNHSE